MRFLYISYSTPLPPTIGGNQRSNIVLRALKERGEVELLISTQVPESELAIGPMREQFGPVHYMPTPPSGGVLPWSLVRPLGARRVDQIAGLVRGFPPDYVIDAGYRARTAELIEGGKFDLIVCRYAAPAIVTGASRYAPSVLDVDDLDTHILEARAAAAPAWSAKRAVRARFAAQVRRLLPGELAKFDCLTFSSEEDVASVVHPYKEVLPNIPYFEPGNPLRARPVEGADPDEMVAVATWSYPPNHEGLTRFLRSCWGRIRSAHLGAKLNVVGLRVSEEHRALWTGFAGVRITGFVEDVGAAYERAAFSVAPVYVGGGTKIKVLESLALGRTCVVTAHAHRGYESTLRDGEALLRGETDEGLAEACVRLLKDRGLRERLSEAGYRAVVEHYSFERVRRVLNGVIDRLTAQGGGRGVRRRAEAP